MQNNSTSSQSSVTNITNNNTQNNYYYNQEHEPQHEGHGGISFTSITTITTIFNQFIQNIYHISQHDGGHHGHGGGEPQSCHGIANGLLNLTESTLCELQQAGAGELTALLQPVASLIQNNPTPHCASVFDTIGESLNLTAHCVPGLHGGLLEPVLAQLGNLAGLATGPLPVPELPELSGLSHALPPLVDGLSGSLHGTLASLGGETTALLDPLVDSLHSLPLLTPGGDISLPDMPHVPLLDHAQLPPAELPLHALPSLPELPAANLAHADVTTFGSLEPAAGSLITGTAAVASQSDGANTHGTTSLVAADTSLLSTAGSTGQDGVSVTVNPRRSGGGRWLGHGGYSVSLPRPPFLSAGHGCLQQRHPA